MSTYLEICKDVARECDIAKGEGAISAVTGNTGEVNRIVNWVKDAWIEIQNRHENWRWMRREFTLDTVDGTREYTFADCTDVIDNATISRFTRWVLNDKGDPPRMFLTSAGSNTEIWLIWTEWEWFKRIYNIGALAAQKGHPAHVTVDHQNNLKLGQIPNDIYTVTGDYYIGAQVLTDNDDVPDMPVQYHQLITYVAMEKYALTESAPEVMARAEREGGRKMRQLERDQMQRIRLTGPMA